MASPPDCADFAFAHLRVRLRPIHRALREAVARQARAAERLARPDVTPLCVTDDHVAALLDDVDALLSREDEDSAPTALTDAEQAREDELRREAAAAGFVLPLDELTQVQGLAGFEVDAVLLCLAPELDKSYERVFGYILDDLNRRFPCVDLVCHVAARGLRQCAAARQLLGPLGRLRRRSILVAGGDAPTSLREELRPAPGLVDFVLGRSGLRAQAFVDPKELVIPRELALPPTVDRAQLAVLAAALRSGGLHALGVFGPRDAGHIEVVRTLGALAQRSVRRWQAPDERATETESLASLKRTVAQAAGLGALLWIPVDPLHEGPASRTGEALDDMLATATVPLVLTGTHRWRPARLLAERSYAELEIEAPGFAARASMWRALLPDLPSQAAEDLAARFRLPPSEMRAAANVARTRSALARNGEDKGITQHIGPACATVTQRSSGRFVTAVTPGRRLDELVLPHGQHQQAIEVADAFRAWPGVSEAWGFRSTGSGPGLKVLFSGDSGTGKTLAAEVIAGMLGIQLLKVDLARVVSKWVGETEKNLETAFREGEQSHAVLFFDEAEALFGKRGESQTGTDRYANLEVSYLLQRLESYDGLVILATNMKEQIDPAFARRFHIVIRFPRPREPERRRIWRIAFPKGAPLGSDFDWDLLASLDLTGAGIASAARTAALLAADAGDGAIAMGHVVRAVQRQFDKEGRVLPAGLRGGRAAEGGG